MSRFGMRSPACASVHREKRWARLARAALVALLAAAPAVLSAAGYEVWVSDQANTQGFSAAAPAGTHGGRLWIHEGANLERNPPLDKPMALDATKDLFPTADVGTGAHVARLHGILPSPDHRFMALNFVASGHLGIVDGKTRRPVCLFRTTGTSTGRQNHMSTWAPSGRSLLVANQAGRLLERVDFKRGDDGAVVGFDFNAAATLDLVGGAGRILAQPVAMDMDGTDGIACTVSGMVADGQPTTTPTGAPKQAVGLRPTNTLICPIPSSSDQHAFATLGGGGLFVVDVRGTPMMIVAEYDLSVVRAAGGGGVEAAGFMHLNSGTSAPHVSEFTLYRFPLAYPSAPSFNAANSPAPVAVWADADNGKLAGAALPAVRNRDAHGLVLARDPKSGAPRYLHQMDRIRNNVEVFRLAPPWNDLAGRHEGSYSLSDSGACGATAGATKTNDPTPDLGDLSVASGRRIYVALRGPFPLTVSHAADGSCPGLGIVTLSPDRKSGKLSHVLPTTVMGSDATKNLSDPHAVVVRLKTR